ncbi:MAG: DUF1446 domain-containing protein [Halioglobus sp.]|nr:DUF1446 domain-containing protein [Halioglobus sp.]
MTDAILRIGGASGFWGDAARATPQLLDVAGLDYIVYDYLAEITMSIMARARAKDELKGYASDFVSAAMKPNLAMIAERGIKVISNAGGVNPKACVQAMRLVIAEQGLNLTVACVVGDDLLGNKDGMQTSAITEMFSGATFPPTEKLLSINAYLGAFPIAKALASGADIVITGRCVDSAVTLGACIHAFGWTREDFDQLAMGSLAGHILECGPQATGGNFTDWEQVQGLSDMGYPIAEISHDGSFVCTKPKNTGGLVTVGTVSEQMLYEIGDPQAYILPDVICDFSTARIQKIAENRVHVSGAKGRMAPDRYKVSVTYADEYRGGTYMTFYGLDANRKAQALGEAIFEAARRAFNSAGLSDFSETSIELLGTETHYGAFSKVKNSREIVMKIAVKHPEIKGVSIFLKEAVGLGLATPPGLSGFAGSRPSPSPVVRLFSYTVPKDQLQVRILLDDKIIDCDEVYGEMLNIKDIARPKVPTADKNANMVKVPLVALAWGRSGDKGDKANIGIIARRQEYLPYIYAALTETVVRKRFAHFLSNTGRGSVERYLLPASNAINFLLHDVLGGGGVASIRNDAQGKGYAQLLLSCPISIPTAIAETLS